MGGVGGMNYRKQNLNNVMYYLQNSLIKVWRSDNLKSTTTKRHWLKIKQNSEAMPDLFLVTALPLVS